MSSPFTLSHKPWFPCRLVTGPSLLPPGSRPFCPPTFHRLPITQANFLDHAARLAERRRSTKRRRAVKPHTALLSPVPYSHQNPSPPTITPPASASTSTFLHLPCRRLSIQSFPNRVASLFFAIVLRGVARQRSTPWV